MNMNNDYMSYERMEEAEEDVNDHMDELVERVHELEREREHEHEKNYMNRMMKMENRMDENAMSSRSDFLAKKISHMLKGHRLSKSAYRTIRDSLDASHYYQNKVIEGLDFNHYRDGIFKALEKMKYSAIPPIEDEFLSEKDVEIT